MIFQIKNIGFEIVEMPDSGFTITEIASMAKTDFNVMVDVRVIRIDIDGNMLYAKVCHGAGSELSDVGSTILKDIHQ